METPDMAGIDENEQVTNSEAANEITPEAEASIGDKLSAISDAHEGIEAPSKEDTAETLEQANDTEDNSEADLEGDAESAESENGEQEQSTADAASTLPAAQVRSLKAYGWSDEEIASAVDTPNFAATAARIHQNRTQEIQDWAAKGRAQKETEQEAQGVADKTVIPQKLDVDALKEKYGSDDLIDEVIGPMNDALAQFHAMMPDLQAGQQAANQAKLEAAQNSVELFFENDAMKSYAGAYGTPAEMSEEQYGNRVKLLQMSDDIRTGAEMRNQPMSIHEAMGYAHEMVGGSFKTAAVRKEIKGQVKQRASGVSLKPGTDIASKAVAGGDLSQNQIEKNARERLDALGN